MTTTALLVIDFINDIAHPKGKIARSAERIRANHTLEHTNQVIHHGRKKNWLILFVKVGFHPGYAECPKTSPLFGPAAVHGALTLGTWGTDFHESLAVQKNDIVLVKHRVSCFYATPLETYLRANQITHLVLTGTATNMAIEHTARDAHDRDYSVIVVQDACESASEEAHRAALGSMGRIAKILDTKTLLQE